MRRAIALGVLLLVTVPQVATARCDSAKVWGDQYSQVTGPVDVTSSWCSRGIYCDWTSGTAYYSQSSGFLSAPTEVFLRVHFNNYASAGGWVSLWNWNTNSWDVKLVLPILGNDRSITVSPVSTYVRNSTIKVRAESGWDNGTHYCWFWVVAKSPSNPIATAPLNGAIDRPLAPTFQWNPACGSSAQQIQVSSSSSFSAPLWSATISSTTQGSISYGGPTLAYGTKYFWRIGAQFGGTYYWHQGAPWEFTTTAGGQLTVWSSDPSSGVPITVSPSNCTPNTTTPFSCVYTAGTVVNLTAPATAGTSSFSKWQRNGADYSTARSTPVTINGNYTMTAVYLAPSMRALTVESSDPNSGVGIGVSPSNCSPGTTTPFSCSYPVGTNVALSAPSTAGGNNFSVWRRDGVDYSTNASVAVVLDANHTMTAVYDALETWTFTIESDNPASGVSVGVSSGTCTPGTITPFSCEVVSGEEVTITAPADASGNFFSKWQRDGLDFSAVPSITLTADGDHTLKAMYVVPPPPGTIAVPLCETGSLFSLNVQPGNTALTAVLASIDGQYEFVMTSTCEEGTTSWRAGQPINDLNSIDAFHGYWIRTSSPSAGPIQVYGTPVAPSTTLNLCEGWSMIPYPPTEAEDVTHALQSISGQFSRLFGLDCDRGWVSWDANRPYWLNDLDCLSPDHGYWLNVNDDATLTYPGSGYTCRGVGYCGEFEPLPTWPYFMDLYSSQAECLDGPLPAGTEICVEDGQGTLCGSTVVAQDGEYLLHVLGDDPATPTDEGAQPGDLLTLLLNGTCPVVSPHPWENLGSHQFDVSFDCSCGPSPAPNLRAKDEVHQPLATGMQGKGKSILSGRGLAEGSHSNGVMGGDSWQASFDQNSPYPLSSTHGDWNADGLFDAVDIASEVDYIFAGGPPANPEFIGEVNGTDPVNVLDAVSLIDHVFRGAQPPVDYQYPIDTTKIVDVGTHSIIEDEILFALAERRPVGDGDSMIAIVGGIKRGEIRELGIFRVEVADTMAALSQLRSSPAVRCVLVHPLIKVANSLSCETCAPGVNTSPSDPGFLFDQHEDFVLNRIPKMWESAATSDVIIGVIDDYAVELDELRDRVSFAPRSLWLPPPATSHGTAICSIIGAKHENGLGIAGVLPECNIVFFTAGVAPGAGTSLGRVMDGLYYFTRIAALDGKRVIVNLSLEKYVSESWDARSAAILMNLPIALASQSGVLLIAAAGNGDQEIVKSAPDNTMLFDELCYPASFPEVLAVGSVGSDDVRIQGPGGSNWGHDVIAARVHDDILDNSGVKVTLGGTSFASPVVAAVAAAIWCLQPELSATGVRNLLVTTSDRNYVDIATFGYGRLNAFRAVQEACGTSLTEDPIPGRPTGLQTSATPGLVELTWDWLTFNYRGDFEADIASYHVYRRNSVGRWENLTMTAPVQDNAYSDTKVSPTVTYWYRVTAVDDAGQEGYGSDSISVTIPACDPGDLRKSQFVMDMYSTVAQSGFGNLPPGACVVALDPQGVVCGMTEVAISGAYLIHVLGDDPVTVDDEGALPGDVITLLLDGECVLTSTVVWSNLGSVEYNPVLPCD